MLFIKKNGLNLQSDIESLHHAFGTILDNLANILCCFSSFLCYFCVHNPKAQDKIIFIIITSEIIMGCIASMCSSITFRIVTNQFV